MLLMNVGGAGDVTSSSVESSVGIEEVTSGLLSRKVDSLIEITNTMKDAEMCSWE